MNSEFNSNHHHALSSLFQSNNSEVAVYTVLKMLHQMKATLSLEAMLEYMQAYLEVIEIHDPQLKEAVKSTLEIIDIEVVYRNACS